VVSKDSDPRCCELAPTLAQAIRDHRWAPWPALSQVDLQVILDVVQAPHNAIQMTARSALHGGPQPLEPETLLADDVSHVALIARAQVARC
jgi:hypothetical protein